MDRATYDRSIAVLTDAVARARIGDRERTDALRRLADHDAMPPPQPPPSDDRQR